jgi:hypothetical protein
MRLHAPSTDHLVISEIMVRIAVQSDNTFPLWVFDLYGHEIEEVEPTYRSLIDCAYLKLDSRVNT